LLDFYDAEVPLIPHAVLVADPLGDPELAQTLSQRIGKSLRILHPQRGPKKRLIELARANAQELLRRRPAVRPVEEAVAALAGLARVPWRVEVFDNSHMMGSAPVGAMVVWDHGSWDKTHYRRYALEARDEYAQMEAMLTRRIARFDREPPPDLWLLDGGETLRQLAVTLLDQAGVTLDVIALAKEKLDAKAHRAKGAARDRLATDQGILTLEPSDARLQWCQRLRDEAHRFAIAYHQQRKRRHDTQVAFLERHGIGPATVKKLIDYFGSFEAIRAASLEELSSVIGKKMALRVQNTPE